MSAQIRIRAEQLDMARRAAGLTSNGALARAMDVHPTTIARTLSGEAQLSGPFIAGVLSAFPQLRFDDLFEVEAPAVLA